MVDVIAKFNRVKKIEDKQQAKYHIYPEGFGGCSSVRKCPTSRAQKLAGIRHPKKIILPGWIGITNEKGGMRTGTVAHGEVQVTLEIDYENHKDDDPEYEGLNYNYEVYVIVKITNNYIVISPVDIIYSKDGAIILQMIEFKDFKEFMPVVKNKDLVVEIYDIKSGGDFNFYKHLKEGKIPDDYMAQFHIYMKGTGKKKLGVFAYHKQYGRVKVIDVIWSDEFWDKIVEMQERVDELVEHYKKRHEVYWKEPILETKDLACLWKNDNIDWYSCPLSITREEMSGMVEGKPKLVLVKPCEHACKILKDKATAQFIKLTKWKRGKSHVRIIKTVGEVEGNDLINYLLAINMKKKKNADTKGFEYIPLKPSKHFTMDEYIMSKNKSGTVYVDTLYEAFAKYKEI